MVFIDSLILLPVSFLLWYAGTRYVTKLLWPKTCSTLDGVASHHIDWNVAYRSTDYMKIFPKYVTYVIQCLLFAPSLFFVEGGLSSNVFLFCYGAVGFHTHVLFPVFFVSVFGQLLQGESAWWKWGIDLFCVVVGVALPFVDFIALEEGPVLIPLVSNFLLMILVAVACSTQVSAIYFSEDKVLLCKNWLESEFFLYEKTELQYSRKEIEIPRAATQFTWVTLKDVKQRKTVATFRLYERFAYLLTYPCNREQVLAALQTLQEV